MFATEPVRKQQFVVLPAVGAGYHVKPTQAFAGPQRLSHAATPFSVDQLAGTIGQVSLSPAPKGSFVGKAVQSPPPEHHSMSSVSIQRSGEGAALKFKRESR